MTFSTKHNRFLIAAILLVGLGCLLVAGFMLRALDARNQALRNHLGGLQDEISNLRNRLAGLETEAAYLEHRMQLGKAAKKEVPGEHEDWISYWVGNVELLNEFMARNPQLYIPEMELLDAEDMLAAVQGIAFESKADYSKAAARLRHSAKLKVSDDLKGALAAYLEESGGELPTSIDQVAARLDNAIARDALQRFEIGNTTQMYDGMRISGDNIVLIETPAYVDDTWFSQICYSAGGAIMYQQSYEHMDRHVREVMTQYEQENGRPAVEFEEVLPYLGNNASEEKDRSRYAAIFSELHQKPGP